MLPADDVSYGFDNIAGVQRMSPTLMERYIAAAQKISSLAVGASPRAATTDTFPVPPELRQDDRVDGLPFGTRGGTSLRYTFPRDGEYAVRVQLTRYAGASFDDIPVFDETAEARAERRWPAAARLRAASGRGRRWTSAEPASARCRVAGPFPRQGRAANRRPDVPQQDAGAAREPSGAVPETRSGRPERLLHDTEGRLSPNGRNHRAVQRRWSRRYAEPSADFRLPPVVTQGSSPAIRRKRQTKPPAQRRFSRRWPDEGSGGRSAIRTCSRCSLPMRRAGRN